MSQPMDSIATMIGGPIVLVSISIVVLSSLAFLVISLRRQRQQLRALIARLNEIEGFDSELLELPVVSEASLSSVQKPQAASADVLAGRSSFVHRAISDRGAETTGLAVQAIACVHRHLGESVSPSRLAGELYLSLRSLERGLLVALDCTPRQLILAMKMREARKLLESGSLQVSEVAYRLAFSSPAHFSRRFKAFYHVSPSTLLRPRRERD